MKRLDKQDYFVFALWLITVISIYAALSFFGVELLISLIISIGVGILLLFLKGKSTPIEEKKPQLQKVSAEKEKFYISKGLSKEDIQYFRETMNTTKQKILKIEKEMNRTGKLRSIAHRNNVAHLSKQLFKAIIEEPNRLHEVDQFLYVHLPSLADLTEKYVEIDNHQKKSRATFDILEKSAETIDLMCQQIAEDYVKFKSSDIENMDLEVRLAKQMLDKDNIDIEEETIEFEEV